VSLHAAPLPGRAVDKRIRSLRGVSWPSRPLLAYQSTAGGAQSANALANLSHPCVAANDSVEWMCRPQQEHLVLSMLQSLVARSAWPTGPERNTRSAARSPRLTGDMPVAFVHRSPILAPIGPASHQCHTSTLSSCWTTRAVHDGLSIWSAHTYCYARNDSALKASCRKRCPARTLPEVKSLWRPRSTRRWRAASPQPLPSLLSQHDRSTPMLTTAPRHGVFRAPVSKRWPVLAA